MGRRVSHEMGEITQSISDMMDEGETSMLSMLGADAGAGSEGDTYQSVLVGHSMPLSVASPLDGAGAGSGGTGGNDAGGAGGGAVPRQQLQPCTKYNLSSGTSLGQPL